MSDHVTTGGNNTCKNQQNDFAASLAIRLQKEPDLAAVIEAWARLPEHIKRAIMALVRTAHGQAGK